MNSITHGKNGPISGRNIYTKFVQITTEHLSLVSKHKSDVAGFVTVSIYVGVLVHMLSTLGQKTSASCMNTVSFVIYPFLLLIHNLVQGFNYSINT